MQSTVVLIGAFKLMELLKIGGRWQVLWDSVKMVRGAAPAPPRM